MSSADAPEPLLRFLSAARSAGIRISTAESMDALRAVSLVGYEDREGVRDALSLVVAKSAQEHTRLRECFDRYFRRTRLGELDAAARPLGAEVEDAIPLSSEVRSPLGRLLVSRDRAELARLIEEAAAALGIFGIAYVSQRALYARRIMDRLGLAELDKELARLRAGLASQGAFDLERLLAARKFLTGEVHAFVDEQFALLARGLREQAGDDLLQRVRLSALDTGQRDRMKAVVRAIVKRLKTRYGPARKRRLRGELDARATLRRNLRHGGIPFVRAWKQRRIEKPRVMALCDVSGSVAPMAEFLLLFLHGLHEALSDLRSFAFSSHLIETTQLVAKADADDAIAAVLAKIGYGSSNYGRSLADFEASGLADLDQATTVILLGDGRGNRTEPRVDVLRRIFERSRRVIWLNPEPRPAWGTGDSDMPAYAKYCTSLVVCNTVRHLEEVVTGILDR